MSLSPSYGVLEPCLPQGDGPQGDGPRVESLYISSYSLVRALQSRLVDSNRKNPIRRPEHRSAGFPSGCGLSELLTDVNMHIVSTELGINGGVDIPSSFTTGIIETRS